MESADAGGRDQRPCSSMGRLGLGYDVRAANQTVYRILKPGGCVLVTVSGIAQIAAEEMEYCGDYWRFTRLSLRRLFEEVFPADRISVESHGNVLASCMGWPRRKYGLKS